MIKVEMQGAEEFKDGERYDGWALIINTAPTTAFGRNSGLCTLDLPHPIGFQPPGIVGMV
jgi:hypothetical protein